jgi:hypothetical protein
MRHSEEAIANAKLVLKQAGYYIDNLWHVNDIKDRFDCDDKTAQEILHDGLTNEYIIDKIFEQTYDFAATRGLKEK